MQNRQQRKESSHTEYSGQRMWGEASERRVRMGRGLLWCGCLVALLVLGGCEKKEEAPKAGPPEVLVAEVAQQNVPIFQEWVAQLTGPVNADITPKVQGYLLKQDYQNGYFVKKGQLLFELDPRQYQAALEQAQANVEVALAGLSEADNNVARDTPLAAQNAIPQKQLDTDLSSQAARKAQVEAAKAVLDNAKLNLAWTKVYSPIDGIAGNSNSQIGDLVGTTTKMATVSQVNPIWVNFNISESAYLGNAAKISELIRSGKPGTTPVRYIQANGENYPQVGRIVQVNRQVASWNGNHSDDGRVPKFGSPSAARWFRRGADPDSGEQGCAAGAAACGHRSAVAVSDPGGDPGEQGDVPAGQGR